MNLLLTLDFAYGILFLSDLSALRRAVDWTAEHNAQGFARTNGVVNVAMIESHGTAVVATDFRDGVPWRECSRAVVVPFHSVSGVVLISAPEQSPPDPRFDLPAGHYALTIAQRLGRPGRYSLVELYLGFEAREHPLERSQILKADEEMNARAEILETATLLP